MSGVADGHGPAELWRDRQGPVRFPHYAGGADDSETPQCNCKRVHHLPDTSRARCARTIVRWDGDLCRAICVRWKTFRDVVMVRRPRIREDCVCHCTTPVARLSTFASAVRPNATARNIGRACCRSGWTRTTAGCGATSPPTPSRCGCSWLADDSCGHVGLSGRRGQEASAASK